MKAIAESQQRKAARETARILIQNRDFKAWSEEELYQAIIDKENPVFLDKTPVSA